VKKLLRVQRRDESYAAAFSSTIAFGDTSYTQASIKPPQSERNINGPKRSSSVVSTIHSSSGKPRRKARQTTVDTSVTGKTNRLTGQKSTLEYSGKNLEKKARLKHCKREVSGRQEYGLARTTPATDAVKQRTSAEPTLLRKASGVTIQAAGIIAGAILAYTRAVESASSNAGDPDMTLHGPELREQ